MAQIRKSVEKCNNVLCLNAPLPLQSMDVATAMQDRMIHYLGCYCHIIGVFTSFCSTEYLLNSQQDNLWPVINWP